MVMTSRIPFLVAGLLAGCTGAIGAGGTDPAPPAGPGQPTGASGTAGPGAPVTGPMGVPQPATAPLAEPAAFGPIGLGRLTRPEIRQALIDLLGVAPPALSLLPEDVLTPFDNDAKSQSTSAVLIAVAHPTQVVLSAMQAVGASGPLGEITQGLPGLV